MSIPITPFTTKVNKRPIGQELLITNEQWTIPSVAPFVIRTVEVPLLNPANNEDVTIPGFTRVSVLNNNTPGVGNFYVNFSDGRITFDSSAAGQTVLVTYYGLGSEVDADDINGVQNAINTLENELNANLGPQNTLQLGQLTQSEEDSLVATLTSANGGIVWFNTTVSEAHMWNGNSVVVLG